MKLNTVFLLFFLEFIYIIYVCVCVCSVGGLLVSFVALLLPPPFSYYLFSFTSTLSFF